MTAPLSPGAWLRRRRSRPLTFTLDGVTHLVPDHPARVWVVGLLSEEPVDVLLDVVDPALAGMLWEDACDFESPITEELLITIGRSLLGQVAGRPWWQVSVLLGVLIQDWALLDGRAADRALGDPLDWPLERLCNWIYSWWVAHPGPGGQVGVDRLLSSPPAHLGTTGPDAADDEDDDAAGWLAMAGMGQVGVGG